ncbi:MAG TPA: S1 RNA-binding domain-containing protein [Bacillota bacterium]
MEPAPAPLQIGDRVQAVVTGFARYGVFVTTREGHRGLVHISEIADWFVEDARAYFRMGDEITVEVIDRQDATGKYAFSTRRVGGPGSAVPAAQPASAAPRRLCSQEDVDELVRYISGRAGEVSPEAREELIRLVSRHGAVRVALAVGDVSRRFDHATAFVQWVGRRLDGS